MINAVLTFIIGTAFRSVLNLISVVILSNIIGPLETGIWIAYYAAISIFQFFLEMGQGSIILKKKDYYSELGGFFIVFNILVLAIFLVSFGVFSDLRGLSFWMIEILIVLVGLTSISGTFLISIQLAEEYVLNQTIPLVVLIIGTLVALAYSAYDKSYLVFVLKFTVECLLNFIVCFYLLFKRGVTFKFNLKKSISIIEVSDVFLALGEFLFKIGNQVDKFILSKVATLEFLGGYGRAQSLTIQGVSVAISSLNPYIFQKKESLNSAKNKLILCSYYVGVGVFGSIAFYFLGDFLVIVLFGAEWLAIIESTKFLCLFPLIRSMENYYFLICNTFQNSHSYVLMIFLNYVVSFLIGYTAYQISNNLQRAIITYCIISVIILGLVTIYSGLKNSRLEE